MIQKKICLTGTSGVGKTGLVAGFVHSLFSEKYLTTEDAKIDMKIVRWEAGEVSRVLWNLEGDDEFQSDRLACLRGTSGCLRVADATRPVTHWQAIEIQKRATTAIGSIPRIRSLNKADLESRCASDSRESGQPTDRGWSLVRTIAKTAPGVELAFLDLARRTLQLMSVA